MSLATRIAEEINTVRGEITLNNSIMSKAQFNALAEERKANRAGSGFDEWGKHFNNFSLRPPVNEGIGTIPLSSNIFTMGWSDSDGVGISKTKYPVVSISGVKHLINGVGVDTVNLSSLISLPTAPNIYPYDTVLTPEQIASGVIKHADASNSGLIVNGKFDTDTIGWVNTDNWWSIVGGRAYHPLSSSFKGLVQSFPFVAGKTYTIEFDCEVISGTPKVAYRNASNIILGEYIFSGTGKKTFTFIAPSGVIDIAFFRDGGGAEFYIDNISVYPADAISRSDLVFLESWHEDISEKNFVYPLGNVQYLGGNTDGLTGIANGAFTGFETYSNFGVWQTPSALIGKGYVWSSLTEAQKRAFAANPENNCYLDGDKVIQVRYRVRVVQGLGDSWNYPLNSRSWVGYSSVVNTWIKAKGKQVNISDYISSLTSEGGYVGGITASKDVLSLAGDYGIYGASNNGSLSTQCGYEGKCFALPIALVQR